jgi:Flp pilus assembly protein TadD
LALLAASAAGLAWWFRGTSKPVPAPVKSAQPMYVGGEVCAGCHAQEAAAWRGSQHARAMQPATAATVLGDFADATFSAGGVTSTFFQRDGGFFVRTDGPDGGLADFAVTWTFGLTPLQQLLVDFPGGRKQALGIAWDARAADAGGQRWFHLYPGQEPAAGERLHWTSIDQNWNHQCADCHSTNLRKGYDEKTDTFTTTWTDVSVGCEACHGPGSAHVAWASSPARAADAGPGLTAALDERRGVAWTFAGGAVTATRTTPRTSAREIDVCARCHARRGQLTDEHVAGQPFLDAFRPALLEPGLFFADGQQRDEVYTWASFLQSRMHAAGVTCADCHEPHTGRPRAPGNAVCAPCHAAATFDAPEHHHHAPGSAGASCAGCHMPPTTYMVVDLRHDHSMRIPRPDLSVTLGTPNACTGCHGERDAAWAAQAVAGWFPTRQPGFQDFAEAFAGADRGEPKALARLVEIASRTAEPAIVRASALLRLSRFPSPEAFAALEAGARDRDALVRLGAAEGLGAIDAPTRAVALAPLLGDPVRVVRIEAARALAGTPAVQDARGQRALDELVAELRFGADRPEAHLALGNLAVARGDDDAARVAFTRALAIEPSFSEAAVNLADVLRARGDEAGAEVVLRDALTRGPAAGVHHALGLSLVRQHRPDEALAEFSRAAALAPDDARFAYVQAIALHDGGRLADALRAVDAALGRHPWNRELLLLGATWYAEAGERERAVSLARRLGELAPGDAAAQRLLQALER